MPVVDKDGYVCVVTKGIKPIKLRDTFLVKYGYNGKRCVLKLGSLSMDESYAGKRIRIKVEVVDDGKT